MTTPSSVARGPSYVEHEPVPALAHAVRTVWVQTVGPAPYLQRHLPTGGVELQWPLGGRAHLVGPLTGPLLESIPARTVVVGIRFRPGSVPALVGSPAGLVDQRVAVHKPEHRAFERVGEAMAQVSSPDAALLMLQRFLLRPSVIHRDPLIDDVLRRLMPWRTTTVATVAEEVGLSASQLRRRCLHALGIGPKALQRTLRFQGFLACAQRDATGRGRPHADGIAALAADAGYADQAHLSREVRRLTGLTPTELLDGDLRRCGSGHLHAASYAPFLADRFPRLGSGVPPPTCAIRSSTRPAGVPSLPF